MTPSPEQPGFQQPQSGEATKEVGKADSQAVEHEESVWTDKLYPVEHKEARCACEFLPGSRLPGTHKPGCPAEHEEARIHNVDQCGVNVEEARVPVTPEMRRLAIQMAWVEADEEEVGRDGAIALAAQEDLRFMEAQLLKAEQRNRELQAEMDERLESSRIRREAAERERDDWRATAGSTGERALRAERELGRLREAICAEAHIFPPGAVAGTSCYCGKAAW